VGVGGVESSKIISTKSRQMDIHEVWVHCGTMRAKSQSWAESATAVDIDIDSCLEDETV